MCGRIWLPSPSTKRPPEAPAISHAAVATVIGLRPNATTTAVPISMRSVASAATAQASSGSRPSSLAHAPPKPSSSARRAASAVSPSDAERTTSKRTAPGVSPAATTRADQGMDFVRRERYLGHMEAAAVTAPRPPHPVRLRVDDDLRRSRLTVFFRLLLVIPHLIVLSLFFLVALILLPIHWIAPLIAGRPVGALHTLYVRTLRYATPT